jgi:hypothetical protein
MNLIDRLKWVALAALLGLAPMLFVGVSVGSTMRLVAQDPLPAVSVSEAVPELQQASEKSLKAFRKELLQQAQMACDRGEISQKDVRRLRAATFFSKACCERLHGYVSEEIITQSKGVTSSQVAVAADWSKWAEIIKTLLPVLLELLSMFFTPTPGA